MSHLSPLSIRGNRIPILGWYRIALICLVSHSIMGCSNRPDDSTVQPKTTSIENNQSNGVEIRFVDRTKELSIESAFKNGEESNQLAILESTGGGLGVLDFDRDGWNDLFFVGGGELQSPVVPTGIPSSLWRNLAGESYVNATKNSKSDLASGYSQGIACGDVNNDGFPDILVTSYSGLQLFVNQGDGTFKESAQSIGLDDSLWSTSAGFGDFNNDGSIDLYVAHYVDWSWEKHPSCKLGKPDRDICAPGSFTGLNDSIYLNNQDGTFRLADSQTGLLSEGKGLGVLVADFNQDSKIDIYVANDTTNNFLYINTGDARFNEVGLLSGTAVDDRGVPNGSMGLCALDFDRDLQTDIFVCNYESQAFALYKNDGNSSFRYVTSTSGLSALGTAYVAFGTTANDFDSDGDEDIVIANGHVIRFPANDFLSQPALLMTNNGKGRFRRAMFDESSYFGKKWRGRGVVAFDLERDGDLDLAFANVNQPAAVLENQTKTTGKWCTLDLIGTRSNRDAIGARIVFTTNKRSYLRNIVGGGSYVSQNPYTVHCAFPEDEELVETVCVWPNGQTQTVTNININAQNQLIEPF